MEAQLYRPSPFVAISILLLPVIVTLVAAILFLSTFGGIPLWLPFLILLWIPCLPVLWLAMQSAQTSTLTLAAGRPWRPWVELPWDSIERVEQLGFIIQATASDGRKLTIMPVLLRDGARLRREFLLRLPPQVLSGSLGQQAKKLFPDIQASPEGRLTGTLRAHPKRLWRTLAFILGCTLIAAGFLSLWLFGLILGIFLALGGLILGSICLLAFVWLLQEILINENEISRTIPFRRRSSTLEWSEIELIEHSSHEYVLRLRGPVRIICVGPSLLPTAERDLMRAYIHEYGISRGIPTVRRTWILV
ncbi:MAG: hypothetical protein C5B60_11120 [Chloroflexi bacterium]|nr:MAG: hypothetical protein C5B60_11120 [Chloroflexota bacterium]